MPTYRPTNPGGSVTGRPAGQGLTGSEETRFRVGRGGGTYRYQFGKDSVNVFIDSEVKGIKLASIGGIEVGLGEDGAPIWRAAKLDQGSWSLDLSPKKEDKVSIIDAKDGILRRNGVALCPLEAISGTLIALHSTISDMRLYHAIYAVGSTSFTVATYGLLGDSYGFIGQVSIDATPEDMEYGDARAVNLNQWYVAGLGNGYVDLTIKGNCVPAFAGSFTNAILSIPYFRVFMDGHGEWRGLIPSRTVSGTGSDSAPQTVLTPNSRLFVASANYTGVNAPVIGYPIKTSANATFAEMMYGVSDGYLPGDPVRRAFTANAAASPVIYGSIDASRSLATQASGSLTTSNVPAGTWGSVMSGLITDSNVGVLIGKTSFAVQPVAKTGYSVSITGTRTENQSNDFASSGDLVLSGTCSVTFSDGYVGGNTGSSPTWVTTSMRVIEYGGDTYYVFDEAADSGYVTTSLVNATVGVVGVVERSISQSFQSVWIKANDVVLASTQGSIVGTWQIAQSVIAPIVISVNTSMSWEVLGTTLWSDAWTDTSYSEVLFDLNAMFDPISSVIEHVRVITPSDFRGNRSTKELVVWSYVDPSNQRVLMANELRLDEITPAGADLNDLLPLLNGIDTSTRGVCVTE